MSFYNTTPNYLLTNPSHGYNHMYGTFTPPPSKKPKPCVNGNDPNDTYTGKEPSPTGLGFCPAFETIGTNKKGRDGTMWMIAIKNGVKVWIRMPVLSMVKPDSSEVYEDDFEEMFTTVHYEPDFHPE